MRIPLFFVVALIGCCGGGRAWAQRGTSRELGELVIQGQAFEKQLRFKEAADTYSRAESLAAQLYGGGHKFVTTMALAQARVYRHWGSPQQAIEAGLRGLKLAEAAGEPGLISEATNSLAGSYVENSDYQKAVALHERGVKLLSSYYGPDSPQAAVGRGNLAGALKELGAYHEAEALYKQSVQTLQQHQRTHPRELANQMSSLANLYVNEGELARAEALQRRSVDLLKKTYGPNASEVALIENNLAATYMHLGQFDRAEQMYLETIRILEATLGREHVDVARPWINLAAIYQLTHRYDEAEALYRKALSVREKRLGPNHADVALTLHNMGAFYGVQGDASRAEAVLQRAIAIRQQVLGPKHPEIASSLVLRAQCRLFLEGKVAEAKQLLAEALEIRRGALPEGHPLFIEIDRLTALVDAREQRWDDALATFDRCRRATRQYIGRVLPSLSEEDQLVFLKEGDQDAYHTALTLVLARPGDSGVAAQTGSWVLNGKGIVQSTLAQRALMARDTSNAALSSVAKNLLEIRRRLAAMFFAAGNKQPDATRQQRLASLGEQEKAAAETLARAGGRSVSSTRWVELDAVRHALPDDAILVELARFKFSDFAHPVWRREDSEALPRRYVAWLIPAAGKGDVRAIDLGDAAPIDAAVKAARAALEQGPQKILELGEPEAEGVLHPALRALGKLVLDPLLPAIGERKQVCLSPDDDLWLVPWGALPLEGGQYAIEKYDFRYVVSGRDLVFDQSASSAQPPVMFADPNFDLPPAEVDQSTREIFPGRPAGPGVLRATPGGASKLGKANRLPGTKTEAEKVQPLLASYAGSQPLLYTDRWALEAVFKAVHQPRVVVLSTHGFFQPDQPMAAPAGASRSAQLAAAAPPKNPLLRCGMLLAGCNKPADPGGDLEDGILTGLEIVSADLRGTELVVLSACETGLGEVHGGEGVSGLRQAFQLAGARSVVSTLWQIPDRETAKLMSDFFSSLADHAEKGAALRQAQLNLIDARRDRYGAAHPFFWAAFTLTGQ